SSGLRITTTGLAAPPQGQAYIAWMIDDTNERVTLLGTLQQIDDTWHLDYQDKNGQNLLGLGNRIEITQEQGQNVSPLGKQVLNGTMPPLALIHIRHVLVSFPTTPNEIGLLVGLTEQTAFLNEDAAFVQAAFQHNDSAAVQCGLANMLNIIEGSQTTAA